MGLALHDPSDSLSSLTEHRHLPVRGPSAARHKSRLPGREKLQNWASRTEDGIRYNPNNPLRPHQLAALASFRRHGSSPYNGGTALDFVSHAPKLTQSRRTTRSQGWDLDDVHESVELARSSGITLPGEYRRGRPPSLERQGAFRDPSTSKRRRSSGDSYEQYGNGDEIEYSLPHGDEREGADTPADLAAAELAELYHIGLLYDDEHIRGPGFSFEAITHREPAYTLNFRSVAVHHDRTKNSVGGRKRKMRYRRPAVLYEPTPLELQLSCRALGDNDAIANFLFPLDSDENRDVTVAASVGTNRLTNHLVSTHFAISVSNTSQSHNTHSLQTDNAQAGYAPEAATPPNLIPDDKSSDDWTDVEKEKRKKEDQDENVVESETGGREEEGNGEDSNSESCTGWVLVD